jgi:tetratricopeptide (TPR) repeat protein
VIANHFRKTRLCIGVCALALTASLASMQAQAQESTGTAMVHGYVRDSSRKPVANANVFLVLGTFEQALAAPTLIAHTDSEGHYRFAALRAGSYALRAEKTGYDAATVAPVNLTQKETTKVDLFLAPAKLSGLPGTATKPTTTKPSTSAPEFFDEPQFTVAGVAQASNAGGHGSDTVLRTTEALAKATVSLSKESGGESKSPTAVSVDSLRNAMASNPKDPALHHRLGDVEERLGNPLESVREYQRAAELDPSEPNLFDWGTELLTHRALEPAVEVLAKGNHLFPKSVRMLVGLGVAWYARGSYDKAALCLVNASDIEPDNPTPYVFLGKMQSAEANPAQGVVARLARFAQLQPDNALANYYYAVGLWKQLTSAADIATEDSARVESLLLKAIHLNPKLSAAYLQLGIVYSQRADFSQAIFSYRKAIEVAPELDDTLEVAHYRLAQAYLRTGNKMEAHEELKLHDQIAKKTKDNVERARRGIQGFLISLRNSNSGSQPQP